jgi:hypothetical protein
MASGMIGMESLYHVNPVNLVESQGGLSSHSSRCQAAMESTGVANDHAAAERAAYRKIAT